ncbi:MAG: SDR family oxidoreductase [Anaerolineaceae bacterium]|nr:SDR family oxidoreductase [Anaerolineaceae bacterium]
MDLELNGKRALVTGASRGLGYAAAHCLVQEGARVAINSRNVASVQASAHRLQDEFQTEVLALPGDVTDASAPGRIIAQFVERFGGLDILITNAGGPPPGPFESFDDAAWQRALEANFLSHVRLIRAALPFLRQSTAPSVLTITSYSVKQPIPGLILSNSIREATIGLTKTLALELGNLGIRFNSILPGWTDTERVQQIMSDRAQVNQTTIADEQARQSKDIPLGRLGNPAEFAKVAVFLVSPAASYVTGVMLQVDGGATKSTF